MPWAGATSEARFATFVLREFLELLSSEASVTISGLWQVPQDWVTPMVASAWRRAHGPGTRSPLTPRPILYAHPGC